MREKKTGRKVSKQLLTGTLITKGKELLRRSTAKACEDYCSDWATAADMPFKHAQSRKSSISFRGL